MSDKKIEIGDKMVESQLNDKSDILNVSICELIDRYIMRGLFNEDYYEPPKRTREELVEMGKRDVLKDIRRGILPKKHNYDVINRLMRNYDD